MKEENINNNVPEKTKKKHTGLILYLLTIAGFCFYTYYTYDLNEKKIAKMQEECSPVSTSGEIKELPLDSTIVQDLYSKVGTNIKEDAAETELNESLKMYLAYRQISNDKIYESNCNQFDDTLMPSYICEDNNEFTPTAFKEETLKVEYKKLFGENSNFQNSNIQLNKKCIGGYQYISSRGEYVQGYCGQVPTVAYQVTKNLFKATSQESTIVLYEKVKYIGSEGQKLPDNLISGTYKYTFKLDNNYNYIYVSKELGK